MVSRLEQLRLAVQLRRALAQRARFDATGEESRARWRAARLADLRSYALARSPLLRERHRGLEDAPLEALPTTTKIDVVEHFDELVTDRSLSAAGLRAAVDRGDVTLGRYRIAASSGSSGRPGLFAFGPDEWIELLAAAARSRLVAGRPATGPARRSAKIGSPSPWHLSTQLAGTLSDPRRPSLTLDATSGLDHLVDRLQAWRPDVLTGYPSVLAALADAQQDGRLDIAPAQVFSGGERLSPTTRQRIEAAWGTDPFDQYVTTEAGFIAIDCPAHEGLHILDDHVVVEVVEGAVLLTVLGSRTLPLIRYELGDVVVEASGPCSCGRRSPRIGTVSGAARELLRLPSTDGGVVAIHPVAVTAALDRADVSGWQLVQEPERLHLRVSGPGPGFSAATVASELAAAITSAGALEPRIQVQVVDHLPRTGGGKAALVVPLPERS